MGLCREEGVGDNTFFFVDILKRLYYYKIKIRKIGFLQKDVNYEE